MGAGIAPAETNARGIKNTTFTHVHTPVAHAAAAAAAFGAHMRVGVTARPGPVTAACTGPRW